MRILMVHNEYARPSGEEYAVRSLADLLAANGHDIRWLLRSSAEIVGTLKGSVKSFFAGIYNPYARRDMDATLARDNVDLVHVQNIYPLLSPAIFGPCRRWRIPIVMRCPNYRLFCPNGLHLCGGKICERCVGGREWWCVLKNCEGDILKSLGYAVRNAVSRITGMILDNVDVFIVLSEFQKRRFIAAGIEPSRIAIIPNFEAGQHRPQNTPSSPLNIEEGWISFVGRLSSEKGIDQFIEAARKMPHLSFAMAGDSSAVSHILRDIPPNLRLHGFVSGFALDEFYAKTRILIAPSLWYEGFPNVVTRAMVAGKPVIASNIGALPEIVDNRVTGLLFNPGNTADLIDKIQYLMDRPALCRNMGRAGREKAILEYSPDIVYQKIMAVYERLLI